METILIQAKKPLNKENIFNDAMVQEHWQQVKNIMIELIQNGDGSAECKEFESDYFKCELEADYKYGRLIMTECGGYDSADRFFQFDQEFLDGMEYELTEEGHYNN